MSEIRYASVLGLGFGDCGKGHFIDALTRRWQAHTVVRFSGGAQAGHNVVTAEEEVKPARHHTFSQFGAGTFVPGTRTVLLDPMVLHPTALLVEAEVLGRAGVHDALLRLTIDARCRITTPYHQAAGRARELLRGTAAHGTCGVGVGETVRHALQHPELAMHYADFSGSSTQQTRMQLDKLQAIRETLHEELSALCPPEVTGVLADEMRTLRDESLAGKWLTMAKMLARHCPPASLEEVRAPLKQPGCVLFEGAQGVLLDEWRGFHPHTTWSSITTDAVETAAACLELGAPIEHYGVLRSYLTRHGSGPLPTHDEALNDLLPEPHNHSEGWQGGFRRGHPDAVLLRYALDVIGSLNGLLVSHLDVFQRGVKLKWCGHYSTSTAPCLKRLPAGAWKDLAHQTRLTRLLEEARPNYDSSVITSCQDYLERIASVTDLPVVSCSFGNNCRDVREMQMGAWS
ncbi:adenylosuccinate synthetase [Prosthecobacter fluviatilis]|uniref:Adenylosuccinate synthetase n=1 Tax=Prosthecobacter fluviatilis TaxID=445931 RepID=A0ABW0KNS7_9BACT